MTTTQKGFGVVAALAIIVVLGVIGFAGWKVATGKDGRDSKQGNDTQSTASTNDQSAEQSPASLIWRQGATGWEAQGKAPDCPAQPMLKAPADLSKVTSVLYPGQTRGMYKAHGGLRFDTTSDNKITISAPLDGYIVKAVSHFAQGTTEIQYGFDIMNNCGIMYRLGHLRELSPELRQIVDKLPEASADSRSQPVNPAVYVKQGQTLATKTGLISEKNTFFDWGVYDYRQTNKASKSEAYRSAHTQDKETSWYGVCWLDGWLPASDQSKLVALPAGDGNSGKSSDYCE